MITYETGYMDGGLGLPVGGAVLEFTGFPMYSIVEDILFSWSHGALRQKT